MEFEPNIYNKNKAEKETNSVEKEKEDESTKKEKKWKGELNEVEGIVDSNGHPIDEPVKETVAALLAHELPTCGSCGGHIDGHGTDYPWVDLKAPNKPDQIYKNEDKIIKEVARGDNVSFETLKKFLSGGATELTGKEKNALEKARSRVFKEGVSKEWAEWMNENEELKKKMEELIDEFCETVDDSSMRIRVEGGDNIRLIFIDQKGEDLGDLSNEEKKEVIESRREYMQEFTEFLKEKFFEGDK